MGTTKEDHISDPNHLRDRAYRDKSLIAKRRALYEFTSPLYVIEDEVLRLLELQGNEELLDVGCGEGKLLLKAAEQHPKAKFTGVDIAAGMFEPAQSEARRRHLPIIFAVEDVQQLTFSDESFDRVTAIHMIYHVPDMEKAVSEMARVLRPGGVLVLTANGLKSKETLRVLKSRAADLLGIAQYPDTTLRFNIDTGEELLEKYFSKVKLVPFESRLILEDAQPYVDYFDSTREFWDPYPSDQQWSRALDLVRNHIQGVIDRKGRFEETNLFGAFVASR